MNKRKKKQKKSRVGLQTVTLCISTSLVLILLGLVVFTGLVANNLGTYVKENLTATVLFDDNASNQQAKVVCNELKKRPYVSHIDFVTRDQALKEQTKALGTDPSEFLGSNPFTPSCEIYLSADYANTDSLKWIIKELKAKKLISEVSYQKDLMDSVNKNLRKISLVMIILAALLTFVSFSLISNTVRLTIFARRFTINTMKLVGASWSFIRAPFIRMAILEGLVAGTVADAVLAGGAYALFFYEPNIISVVTINTIAITGFAVLLFGVIISTTCVFFSVNKFLKMKAGDLYKI